jgi:pimeloyl-ACP methyl ester carboxylesterase
MRRISGIGKPLRRRRPESDGGGAVVERYALDTPAVRFRYAVAGVGPPVVLVPGGGGWELTFHRTITELAARHRVFAVDPPGQGGTRVVDPSFGYDADAVARSLGDFLDGVGLPAATVVGHSWGGGFALRLAQLRPERVSALALLAPGGLDVPDVWEFRLLRRPLIGELVTRFASVAPARHMLRKSFAQPERMPRDELIRTAIRQMRSAPDAALLRRDLLRVERGVRWADTERDLYRVQCPTLILWGERDRYLPARMLARFTSRLPDVEAHTLTGCGHSLHDDCPEQVYPLLARFLTGKIGTSALHREEEHDG